MLRSRQSRVIALGWLSRIVGTVVSLATVRVMLRLLGENEYAVFQILSSALAWLTLSSFGLGPALKNLVSESRARAESDAPLRAASGALVGLIFVFGAALVIVLSPNVSTGLLRKLSHNDVWAYRAFLVGGLLSLVGVLGQVSIEVLYADFRAQWVYLLSMAGSALTLLLLVWLGRLGRSPSELLFWALCASVSPQAVIGVVALRMTGLLTLRVTLPDRAAVEKIMKLAARFWVFAILSNLILMVDVLVISQILIAREIVLYSIMMRIAAVALVFFNTVIAVMWPEWTHNWERGQWTMLRKRVLFLATIGVAACVAGAALAVFVLPLFIRLWLRDARVVPTTLLVLELIGYLAIRFWTDVHSAALMSGNRVFVATKFAVYQATITAPLEYVFGRMWGAEGVIFGLVLGFLATAAWMFPHRFYGELRALAASGSISQARVVN